MRTRAPLLGLTIGFCMSTQALAQQVAVITPYLSQPGTQLYLDSFRESGGAHGWDVKLVHTNGDVAAVIDEMDDQISQDIDAIVINVDPSQVEPGLKAAVTAGIPVVGMDAGNHPLISANVTSNGYAMAAETAAYIANRIDGVGNIVIFTYDSFPAVQARGVIADAVFANYPDITVIERITPDISDGAIADSRSKMEAVLAANPDPGSISAVWAAWDQPALGTLEAIEAAGRGDEGIVITGIDANPQAREAIASGGNFEASVAQDFDAIGHIAADTVAKLLAGDGPKQKVIYVPTVLVTEETIER